MPKPTIFIVPGAWHVPAHFKPTTVTLEAAGYTCIGVELPCNSSEPYIDGRLVGIEDDMAHIRKTVLSQLSTGRDVVVVTHSYGCIPGLAALKGLDKATRLAKGESSAVVAVVMIAGFLCAPGETMLSQMGGKLLPQYLHEGATTLPFNGSGAIDLLYNDLEINEALKAVWQLKPQSYAVNTSIIPSQLAGMEGIPLNFLFCSKDNATPTFAQRASIQGFRDAGVEVYAEIAESGHSPFIGFSEETARFVRRAAGEDVESGFGQYR